MATNNQRWGEFDIPAMRANSGRIWRRALASRLPRLLVIVSLVGCWLVIFWPSF
jgi:hypothetical protein